MSSTVQNYELHKENGSSQQARMLEALSPDYIPVDERSQQDLLDFAQALAERIHYYNESNEQEGTWEDFFSDAIAESTPQKALFMAFLKLYAYAQEQLNTLTGRHLDFYYEDVLQLVKKPAIADQIHVVFELAKNTDSYLLESGTLLKAGKDSGGATMYYATEKDIVINTATIASLKTLFLEKSAGNEATQNILAAPVANSADGLGTAFEDDEDTQWATFGDSATGETATLGFAITSPLLFLNEGERTIDIRFTFSDSSFNPLRNEVKALVMANTFRAQVTGAEGWIEGTLTEYAGSESVGSNQIGFSIQLHATQEAVTAYDSTVHEDNFQTPWPLLKIILNGHSSYDYLYSLQLEQVSITVTATGVEDLMLYSDQGTLDASKPFLPFGAQPVIGNAFYIGHSEFQKKLDRVTLNLTWLDAPDNFSTHYSVYDDTVTANESDFQAELSLLHQRSWSSVDSDFELFSDSGTTFDITEYTGYEHVSDPETITTYDRNTQTGFLKLELTAPTTPFKAFGHAEYTGIYTEQAIALANGTEGATLPNAPYTPTIKSLSLDYTATHTLDFSNYSSDSVTQFFHIRPFGYHEYQSDDSLLPQYTDEGTLYIGVSDLVPPQQLSILFRPAEGSASPDNNIGAEDVIWSYLNDGGWVALNAKEIADTTTGLQGTGIVTLDIPGDAVTQNTMMPQGYHWLKATVTTGAAGAEKLIALSTQAVTASFTDQGNDPDQIGQTLQAFSISGLAVTPSEIKSVTQPYPSFNGVPAEQSDAFYTRVSERLRHKNRAVTPWDYERLVLREFPDIYRIKCLNGTKTDTADRSASSGDTAGYVTLVVLPGTSQENAANPLQPRIKTKTLADIEIYLQQYTSPFVTVTARNPTYEPVQLKFKVQFTEGTDEGYYLQLLEEELTDLLSPWADDGEDDDDIVFGNQFYKSAVLDFIEKRAYVDFVTDFLMLHYFEDDSWLNGSNQETVVTSDAGTGTYTYTIWHYASVSGVTAGLDFTLSFDSDPEGTTFIDDLRTAMDTFLAAQSSDTLQRIDVLIFLEAYTGVRSVSALRLFYIEDGVLAENTEKAVAERPGAILTATPIHNISLFDTDSHDYAGAFDTGIGFMVVEGDFTVPSITGIGTMEIEGNFTVF